MPSVSIIVPCYNEQDTITLLLDAVYAQTYPHNQMDVILADGLSTDQTRERIHAFQSQHPDLPIKIVDNYRRVIPSALNRAIETATGEIIIRLDAHSVPAPDYVERCVDLLVSGRGDNVGGIWQIHPGNDTPIARAIAIATSHPLGVGDAYYRVGGVARQVDTVPFGAFRRKIVDRIGPFDESLHTNEDYEFNTRIRQAGGTIWFDPTIKCVYFSRTSLNLLMRQYARYGYWKAQMLRRYPKTLRWRQLLPPLYVAILFILIILASWFTFACWLLGLQICAYLFILLATSIKLSIKEKEPALLHGIPFAIATMHLTWGLMLLWGFIYPPPESPIHRKN